MRITEAAQWLGTSPRMLRYRDMLGLLPPVRDCAADAGKAAGPMKKAGSAAGLFACHKIPLRPSPEVRAKAAPSIRRRHWNRPAVWAYAAEYSVSARPAAFPVSA